MEWKKIRNNPVKPIPLVEDKRKVKGCETIPKLSANIVILAKKERGKTTIIRKIIEDCTDNDSKVLISARTVFNDPKWIYITDWLTKNYYSFDADTNFETILSLVEELEQKGKQLNDKGEIQPPPNSMCEFGDKKTHKKKKKKKYQVCEYLFILDDMTKKSRDPRLADVTKIHRHFDAKCIFSSQYAKDLSPDMLLQADYFILLGGHSDENLKHLFDHANLNVSFEEFLGRYKSATSEKYNFLLVDSTSSKFYKNFEDEAI